MKQGTRGRSPDRGAQTGRFQEQFKDFPIPTYTWHRVDEDFVLTAYNDAGSEATQGLVSTMVGRRCSEMYADAPHIQNDIRRCWEEQRTIKAEMAYRFRTSDRSAWISTTFVYVPPDIVMVHAEDITARRRADELLQKSEALLAAAQKIAHLGSWEWDLAADVVTWSDELYCICGVQREQFTPSLAAWLSLIHPDDELRVRQAINAAIMVQQPMDYYTRIVRADGAERLIHAQARIDRGDDGAAVRMIGTVHDISEQRRTEEIRDLSRNIVEAQEAERRRVTRELHDGVNQILTAARFRIQGLEAGLDSGSAGLRKEAVAVREQVELAMQEIRRISQNLLPPVLDDLGLLAAVRSMCEEFQQRTGLVMDLRYGRFPRRLPADLELALYRIIQEALNNVEKHARAGKVQVRLTRERGCITLRIHDNGVGLKTRLEGARKQRPGHFGLVNMRERAAFLGGTLAVASAPGEGTEILVRIPRGHR